MPYEGQIAETLFIPGHNNETIETYYARPIGIAPVPGVVVIHHAPGWDPWCKEVARKFAHNGYAAILPHLYYRAGPGSWDDVAARARASGGAPDDQVMGDVEGCMAFLRAQPYASGKIGVIGFCSGGRHTYLAACRIPGIDAAVDCWGGNVVIDEPSQLTPSRPVAPIELTEQLSMPLLGLFGNDDQNPSPSHVDRTEETLKRMGKNYEFHRYDGAGHGFFATDRPGYRPQQAVDGWQKVFAFYGRYLNPSAVPAAAAAD